MTVVIPVFGSAQRGGLLMAAWVLGKAVLLLIPLVYSAIKVIPPFLRRVKKTCNSELLLLVAIAICLGMAALAQAVGFSVALGAFLAGVSISSLPDTMLTPNWFLCEMPSWRSSSFRSAR